MHCGLKNSFVRLGGYFNPQCQLDCSQIVYHDCTNFCRQYFVEKAIMYIAAEIRICIENLVGNTLC